MAGSALQIFEANALLVVNVNGVWKDGGAATRRASDANLGAVYQPGKRIAAGNFEDGALVPDHR